LAADDFIAQHLVEARELLDLPPVDQSGDPRGKFGRRELFPSTASTRGAAVSLGARMIQN
jgi:hypothetical protein